MIVVVTNQKGGVGKTTLACHLAWRAAESRSVLAVDLDTQANLTQTLLGRTIDVEGDSAHLFGTGSFTPREISNNLFLLTGGPSLKSVDEEVSLRDAIGMGTRLRDRGQIVVIDTPPAIGVRQVAPYFWADVLVLVLTPDVFSLKGLYDVKETLERVRLHHPKLTLRVVLNRHRPDVPRESEVIEMIRAEVGSDLVDPALLESRSISGSLAERVPVWEYPYKSPARAKAVRSVCDLILGESVVETIEPH